MYISMTRTGTIYTADISGGPSANCLAVARLVNGEYQSLEKLASWIK